MTQTSSTQSRRIFASNTFCILVTTSNNLWWPNTCCATTCCCWTSFDTHTHTHTHILSLTTWGKAVELKLLDTHTQYLLHRTSQTHTHTPIYLCNFRQTWITGTDNSCVVRMPGTLALKTDPVNISNWCARQCWLCIFSLSLACNCNKLMCLP